MLVWTSVFDSIFNFIISKNEDKVLEYEEIFENLNENFIATVFCASVKFG